MSFKCHLNNLACNVTQYHSILLLLIEFLTFRNIYINTHISRCSDGFHFQFAFKFCIVIYYIILGGCPYIISCVVIYKLYTAVDVSNVTCVTKWMNK